MSERVLGELAELTVGHVGSMADQYVDAGVPFLRTLNIEPFRINLDGVKFISRAFHEKLRKSALRPGDVVIARTGSPGIAAVIPQDLNVANCSDLVIVRPGPALDPAFLVYYINGVAKQFIDSRTVGAVQQHFNIGQAREMPMPTLDLSEQRRIAGVLGALDDLIEVNRGLMRDLDDLGMALFRSAWDGESWTPISSLGSVIMGQSPPGSTYNEDGLGTVFFQGVRDFGDRYPRSRVHCTAPTRVADQGDILIAVRAPIGETNVAVERTAIGRGLAALKASQPALALRAVRASERTWAAHQGTGTVFSSISGPELSKAVVPLVDDPALQARLATLDAMHFALAQETDELSATRDELLPLLLSGRVRVAEVAA